MAAFHTKQTELEKALKLDEALQLSQLEVISLTSQLQECAQACAAWKQEIDGVKKQLAQGMQERDKIASELSAALADTDSKAQVC